MNALLNKVMPCTNKLGKLYESGRGISKNMEKSLYWYQQASGISSLQPALELQLEDDITESGGPTIEIIESVK